MGMRYKALAPEELAKWQAKADKAKKVYKEQMAEYEKNKPNDSPAPKSEGKKKKKPEPEPESDDSDDGSSAASDSS